MNIEEIEILLIDDSPEDTDLAVRALRKYHLANKLNCFKDGSEALNFLLQRTEKDADIASTMLILLDLNMPTMGGLEFIRSIKGYERTKHIPIVLLTSTTKLPDIKESLRMGVKCYVPKPIDFEDIARIATELGFSLKLIEAN